MSMTLKPWTGLGLGTLMLTGLLTGCGEAGKTGTDEGEASAPVESAELPPAATAGEAGESGEGEGGEGEGGEGEGGEGGEGGIDFARASSDPVVFLNGLAIAEAHVRAAVDAYREGESAAAAEMFAHPVSEVLFEMEEVLVGQGVEPFDQLFLDASADAVAGATVETIEGRALAIYAALDAARMKAPEDGSDFVEIGAGVVADQIDRAVKQYLYATETDALEPYLDGYGFYRTAEARYGKIRSSLASRDADAAAAFDAALAALEAAYPTALRPAALDADTQALAGANGEVQLVVSGL